MNINPDNGMPLQKASCNTNIPCHTDVQCLPMPKLATIYIAFQCMNCVYNPIQGLSRGTIFPELDRPYGADPEYTYGQ